MKSRRAPLGILFFALLPTQKRNWGGGSLEQGKEINKARRSDSPENMQGARRVWRQRRARWRRRTRGIWGYLSERGERLAPGPV